MTDEIKPVAWMSNDGGVLHYPLQQYNIPLFSGSDLAALLPDLQFAVSALRYARNEYDNPQEMDMHIAAINRLIEALQGVKA